MTDKLGTLVISFIPGEKRPEEAVGVGENAWLIPDNSAPLAPGGRVVREMVRERKRIKK